MDRNSVGVVVVDKDGKIAKMCNNAESLFQWGRDVIGLPLNTLISVTYKEVYDKYVEHQKNKEQQDHKAKCCSSSIVGYRRDCTSFPLELCAYDASTEEKEKELPGLACLDKQQRRQFEHFRRLQDAVDQDRGIKKYGLTFLIRDLSMCFTEIPNLPGSRYRSDFEELETLGKGSFGSVYACKHKLENKVYAVKKIQLRKQAHLELTSNEEGQTERFDEATEAVSSGSKTQDKTQDLDKSHDADMSKKGKSGGVKSVDKKKKKSSLLRAHQPQASLLVHRKLIETKVLAQIESHPNVIRYYGSWIEQEFVLSSHTRRCHFLTKDEFMALGKERTTAPKEAVNLSYVLHIQMQLCATRGYKGGPVLQNSLESWLAHRDEHSVVDKTQSLALFVQIIRGLHHIHASGFLHRDMKPGNILIIKNDSVDYANGSDDYHEHQVRYPAGEQRKDRAVREAGYLSKIGDFGLATKESKDDYAGEHESDSKDTKAVGNKTSGIGTLLYSAPEQLHKTEYDRKVDVYSLGFILIELFCKFENKKHRHKELRAARGGQIPSSMLENAALEAELASQLLSEDPAKRPTTGQLLKHPLLLRFNRKYRLHPSSGLLSPRFVYEDILPPGSPLSRTHRLLSATNSPRMSNRAVSPNPPNSPFASKRISITYSPSNSERKGECGTGTQGGRDEDQESIASEEMCGSPRRKMSGESELEFPTYQSEEEQAFSTSTTGLFVHPPPDRERALSLSSSLRTRPVSSPQIRLRQLSARRASCTPTTPAQSSHRLGLGRRATVMESCSKCLDLEGQITQLKEGELGQQKHLETYKHNLQVRDVELEKQEKMIEQLQAMLKEQEAQLAEKEVTINSLRKNLRAEKERAIYGAPPTRLRNLGQIYSTSQQMHQAQLLQ